MRGSLALGDFEPVTSDLDFLVVTERRVSDAEFTALAALHARLAELPNSYAHHLEGSYIDRAALKGFGPEERRHPALGVDWTFGWGEHGDNWILERWTLREHGVVLLGPVSADALRAAVRGELRNWSAQPDAPSWLLPHSYQVFAVETMCRALYTLIHGDLLSKPRAVAWALEHLGEWQPLVEASRTWRTDETPDPVSLLEVMRFVRWSASVGESEVDFSPP